MVYPTMNAPLMSNARTGGTCPADRTDWATLETDGVLRVQGNDTADATLAISLSVDRSTVRVAHADDVRSFAAASVRRIVIEAMSGEEIVTVDFDANALPTTTVSAAALDATNSFAAAAFQMPSRD